MGLIVDFQLLNPSTGQKKEIFYRRPSMEIKSVRHELDEILTVSVEVELSKSFYVNYFQLFKIIYRVLWPTLWSF